MADNVKSPKRLPTERFHNPSPENYVRENLFCNVVRVVAVVVVALLFIFLPVMSNKHTKKVCTYNYIRCKHTEFFFLLNGAHATQ